MTKIFFSETDVASTTANFTCIFKLSAVSLTKLIEEAKHFLLIYSRPLKSPKLTIKWKKNNVITFIIHNTILSNEILSFRPYFFSVKPSKNIFTAVATSCSLTFCPHRSGEAPDSNVAIDMVK